MKKHLSLLLLFFITMSCGKAGKNIIQSVKDAVSGNFFPEFFAFASPTAPKATTNLTSENFDSDAGYKTKAEAIGSLAYADDAEDCKMVLPDFGAVSTNPSCYGPALDYEDHFDHGTEDGILPPGDLGIWKETQGDVSCAAAKANAEIGNNAKRIDAAILIAANMNCLMKNVPSFPKPDEEHKLTDMTTQLRDALKKNNNGLTLKHARIRYIAGPIYQYEVSLSKGDHDIEFTFKYAPKGKGDAINQKYKGKLSAKFEGGMLEVANSYATSILFERAGTKLNYQMLGTYYNNATVSDPFNDDGDVDVTKNWAGGFTQSIAEYDTGTGLGAMSYAWQAGSGDDYARILNIGSKKLGGDEVAYAYFGFGTKFNPIAGTLSDNTISKFICNWAGPNNNHAGIANTAQKQTMKRDGSGKFVPDALGGLQASFIQYAPINDCNLTQQDLDDQAIVNPGSAFRFKLPSEAWSPAEPVGHQLQNITDDDDYTNLAKPAAPEDF